MNLTNFLLFLILVTLATYLFTPWKNMQKPPTKIKCITIKKDMGWCDDAESKRYYNRLIKIRKNIHYEKLYRKDYKYDFVIPINYNTKNPQLGKGSAIFIHITKKLKPTLGCIALREKDFLILLKIINKHTKIKLG